MGDKLFRNYAEYRRAETERQRREAHFGLQQRDIFDEVWRKNWGDYFKWLSERPNAAQPADSPFRARPETDRWNRELWKNWQGDASAAQPD